MPGFFGALSASPAMMQIQELNNLPEHFVSLIKEANPDVFTPRYHQIDTELRFLDILEMYAGCARVSTFCSQAISFWKVLECQHVEIRDFGYSPEAHMQVRSFDVALDPTHDVLTKEGKLQCVLTAISTCHWVLYGKQFANRII